jgi:hypothetical protein
LLAAAREDVLAGSGAVVMGEGPAGIGKTTLIATARQAEPPELRVLAARGSELERDFPYGIVRQLLEPVLYGASPEERGRWLGGAAALAAPLFEGDAGVGRPEEEVEFRRRHGLYWLVANLARESPRLVAVDDAQWADAPSAAFLRHLAHRLEALQVVLLIGTRPHDGPLTGLLVDPLARVLHPPALSRTAMGDWMSQAFGVPPDAAFAAAGRRATGGNPFLVRELVREVQAERVAPDAGGVQRLAGLSPRGVMTSVLLRLAGLPADAGELARATAVLARPRSGSPPASPDSAGPPPPSR